MSCSGANSRDPDTDETVVFVQSTADGLINVVPSAKTEPVTVLQNDAASFGTETVIDQTSFDIPCSSAAEADMTAVFLNPVTKKTVSWRQLEKQKVVVCEVIHNGCKWYFIEFLDAS